MDKTKYNCSCSACGSDAYQGLSELVCSNMFCKHYKADETKVIQKCEEKVCDDKDKCDDCKQAPIPGYNPLNPFTTPPDSNDCSFTKRSAGTMIFMDVTGTFTWGNVTSNFKNYTFTPEIEKSSISYNFDNVLISIPENVITTDELVVTNNSKNTTYYISKEPPKDESLYGKFSEKSNYNFYSLKHRKDKFDLNVYKSMDGWYACKHVYANLFISPHYLGKDGMFYSSPKEHAFSSLDEAYNKLVEVMDFKFEDYE